MERLHIFTFHGGIKPWQGVTKEHYDADEVNIFLEEVEDWGPKLKLSLEVEPVVDGVRELETYALLDVESAIKLRDYLTAYIEKGPTSEEAKPSSV